MLDITGKPCAVIGGGKVAYRKVRSLLECDAKVTVITRETCDAIKELAEKGMIQLILKDYDEGDLEGFFLVIASSSDPLVNKQVAKEAEEKGVLVNVVDDLENSQFIVPSVIRREDLLIAISTSGKSPLLSKTLRIRLEEIFTEEYSSLIKKLGDAREKAKEEALSAEEKIKWYKDIIDNSGLIP